MRKTYKGPITELPPNGIFQFGSNTEGRHGKGSALTARMRFGAIQGQSKGLQGQSYAIITKDLREHEHPSVSAHIIRLQILNMYSWAISNPDKEIYVIYSANGFNLNGYTNEDMALMYTVPIIPDNVIFEEDFLKLIEKSRDSKRQLTSDWFPKSITL